MDLREGEQTTSLQRLGRASEALLYALCQSVPSAPGQEPAIRVFPAWPNEWDAQFSLLARGGLHVSSSIRKGAIQFVSIKAQHAGEFSIRNPWPGQEVIISRNGSRGKKQKSDLLIMSVKRDDQLIIVPSGSDVGSIIKTLRVD